MPGTPELPASAGGRPGGEASHLRLAATVAALQRPETYAREETAVESIETHMSWVFLTHSFAYKLKKPSRTAQLDYSTLEARRSACETEVRLNLRLAPRVYLGVVPLALGPDGPRVEGPGDVLEWLVKMRRLPRESMLDACIERRAVSPGAIEGVARLLTQFYRGAPSAGLPGPEYRRRLTSDLESKRASLEQPHYGQDRAQLEALVRAQRGWLERHGSLFEARAAGVVEAHGDLRPEHICLGSEPVVIDCLDFDRDLRLLDPLSELSFLGLECRRLGGAWIGEQVLSSYQAATGDRACPGLIEFYQRHHALVRAAVAAWHLDEPSAHAAKWRARAAQYLELAAALGPG